MIQKEGESKSKDLHGWTTMFTTENPYRSHFYYFELCITRTQYRVYTIYTHNSCPIEAIDYI